MNSFVCIKKKSVVMKQKIHVKVTIFGGFVVNLTAFGVSQGTCLQVYSRGCFQRRETHPERKQQQPLRLFHSKRKGVVNRTRAISVSASWIQCDKRSHTPGASPTRVNFTLEFLPLSCFLLGAWLLQQAKQLTYRSNQPGVQTVKDFRLLSVQSPQVFTSHYRN